MTSKLFKQKGHSLIELMIAMFISAIIATGVYGIFHSQQRIFKESEQVIEMQRNARIALNRMEQEIRMAAYNPENIPEYTPENTSGFRNIITADKDNLSFQLDRNEDETQETISYSYNGTTGELLRGGAIIADNIKDFSFNYYLVANSTSTAAIRTANKTSGGMYSTNTPEDYGLGYIRGIEINITYRSKHPDPNYTNPYELNPSYKNYRTLPVVLLIKTRNIGLVL